MNYIHYEEGDLVMDTWYLSSMTIAIIKSANALNGE